MSELPPLGSRFRARRAFLGIPVGTTCTVVEHWSETGCTVEWDRPQDVAARGGKGPVLEPRPASATDTGLRDGFSVKEVEDCLEVIEDGERRG